jgi:hypothetical protein
MVLREILGPPVLEQLQAMLEQRETQELVRTLAMLE